MGTDIHLYVERRTTGGWERVMPPPWSCACAVCMELALQPERPGRVQFRRNYSLFAILANVRNAYGAALARAGEGFVPLAMPRGLPNDTSIKNSDDSVDYESADYVWLGDHSFSWVTLKEALEYDYSRITIRTGTLDVFQYKAWIEAGRGRPKECRGLSGNQVYVSNGKMEELIATGYAGNKFYTEVEWELTYRESVGPHWFAFLEACLLLADSPEDIRFVFGFDS